MPSTLLVIAVAVSSRIEVDVVLLSLVIGTILPVITRLVSHSNASSKTLATVNLVLSLAGAGVSYLLVNNGSAPWSEIVAAVGAAYLASGSTYSHFWKPVGITDAIDVKVRGGIG